MREIKTLVLAALILGLIAGPAAAARPFVTHYRFHGDFAEAGWLTLGDGSVTFSYVNAVKTRTDKELEVVQNTVLIDIGGNFAGEIDTFVDVSSGFTFTIDSGRLSGASMRGADLPATTCSYDADFNLIGCTDTTTIDASATWTGQGPIARGTFHNQYQSDGFKFTDHFQGTSRDATATGTVGSLTLITGDLDFADLGHSNYGAVDICIGC